MIDKPCLATYLMSDDILAKEIEEMKDYAKELLAEKDKRALWTPEFRLSIKIHSMLCHSKDCDFNYQFCPGCSTQTGVEPLRYLSLAQELTNNFSSEQVETIIGILSRYRL